MNTYLSHPTGNQNSRQAALALQECGTLAQFATALHVDAGTPLIRMLPTRLRLELERRDFSDVVDRRVIVSMARLREGVRLAAGRMRLLRLTGHETGWACVDRVYHAVDRAVARRLPKQQTVQAVYAYEDSALATFRFARTRGIACNYELPIGYWRTHRRLCEEEAALQPAWAKTWQATMDGEAKLKRKDQELSLAHRIVVPSQFVADSLCEYPGVLAPVSVVPYGCPVPIASIERRWYKGGRLKVLYVGGLSQRKGLSYLLESVKPLGDAISLTLIGTGIGRVMVGAPHRLLGSVPHMRVIEEMRQHDVFVFPTLFEGYSLAIAEALSQGLPVITTANSGAADIVEDGVQGWIVPIRNSADITRRIEELIRYPEQVKVMGEAALALAATHSWTHYRAALRDAVFQ